MSFPEATRRLTVVASEAIRGTKFEAATPDRRLPVATVGALEMTTSCGNKDKPYFARSFK
jgi:hypothetical protein